MSRATMVLLALAFGCTHDDASEPCDPNHRAGDYSVTYVEIGGTCGPVYPASIHVPYYTALDPQCALLTPDALSADQCTLARSFACDYESEGIWTESSGVTTERDVDLFEGTFTLTAYDWNTGDEVCSSTYSTEIVRQ